MMGQGLTCDRNSEGSRKRKRIGSEGCLSSYSHVLSLSLSLSHACVYIYIYIYAGKELRKVAMSVKNVYIERRD
jgi:hypothetical protein